MASKFVLVSPRGPGPQALRLKDAGRFTLNSNLGPPSVRERATATAAPTAVLSGPFGGPLSGVF